MLRRRRSIFIVVGRATPSLPHARRLVHLLAPVVLLLACETKPSPNTTSRGEAPPATTDAPEPFPPEPIPPEPDPFDIGPGKQPEALTTAQIDAAIPTEPPVLDFWKNGDTACEPGSKLAGAAPPDGVEIRCVDDQGRWTGMEARFHPGEGERLQMIGRRQDGRMVGVWLWFHPNGAKSAEHSYVDGQLHGTMRRWAENGQEIEQAEHRAGRAWGLSVQHDESGKELGRSQLVRGTGLLVRASESRRTESEYVDGLMHGTHREFDARNVVIGESHWSAGEMHGAELRWDPEGRKASEGQWKQGQQHGRFTRWKDGQIIEQSIWIDGTERSRQLFLSSPPNEPLAELPAPTACDDDTGLSNYLVSARGRGLPDEHGCVSRMPLFPGVVMVGDFAYDRGCMGAEWVVDCKLASPAPTAADLLARAGWARASAEQRITIASEYLRDFGLGNNGSISSDPTKPEWTVRPDQGLEGVMWVAAPSGMRRGSEKDKIRFTFAPDGSLQREVLEHVSTLE
jgi:antitoxin component YwqK of YwqJK toxin-antitoxin module